MPAKARVPALAWRARPTAHPDKPPRTASAPGSATASRRLRESEKTAMNTTTQAAPAVSRVAPIVMGRSDYLSVLLRLIRMDLYKVRRRLLSKVLLLIPILFIGGGFLVTGIVAIHDENLPATSYSQFFSCAQFPNVPECLNHAPTLADMRQQKQQHLDSLALYLNIPGNWNAQERFLIERLV